MKVRGEKSGERKIEHDDIILFRGIMLLCMALSSLELTNEIRRGKSMIDFHSW